MDECFSAYWQEDPMFLFMKCLRCLGTTNGDFLGPLLVMIHRWLPYPISQNEPRLSEVPPFLTGSWQCCITLLGWFEPVGVCCFSRLWQPSIPLAFLSQSALPAVSFTVLASVNCVR